MKKILLAGLLLLPVSTFASFNTDLKYGSSGPEVRELQEFLIDQNCLNSQATGYFYTLTLAGVKCFQAKQNISPVSGFFGPLTRLTANNILNTSLATSIKEETTTGTAPVINNDIVTLIQILKSMMQQQNTTAIQIKENTDELVSQQSIQTAPQLGSAVEASPTPTPVEHTITISADPQRCEFHSPNGDSGTTSSKFVPINFSTDYDYKTAKLAFQDGTVSFGNERWSGGISWSKQYLPAPDTLGLGFPYGNVEGTYNYVVSLYSSPDVNDIEKTTPIARQVGSITVTPCK